MAKKTPAQEIATDPATFETVARKRIAAAHELFQAAYRATGRMPAERDAAPTPAESMAWFIRNDRWDFPPEVRAARAWPRFPLNAPWPVLLMLAADDQPLREREEIWAKFRDTGEMRTYGEYIGDIAQQFDMQSARRVAPIAFSYGSIQMMWKDGGVCGTMGNIGARTNRIVGFPDVSGPAEVARNDHLVRTVHLVEGDAAHFGEVSVDLIGKRVLGMASAGDLGDAYAPDTRRAVPGSRHEGMAVRSECHAPDLVGVTAKHWRRSPTSDVPHLRRPIGRHSRHPFAVRGELRLPDLAGRPRHHRNE
jgi:hypothetical protein